MKFFGKGRSDKKEPLIHTSRKVGEDDDASKDNDQSTLQSNEDNLPLGNINSGEKGMILPKHLRKKAHAYEEDEDAYVNLDANVQSNEADDVSTAVASQMSLSTIGASVQRELENARQEMGSQPPLEIKTTKQSLSNRDTGFFEDMFEASGLKDLFKKKKKTAGKDEDIPPTARRWRRDHPALLIPGNEPRVGILGCLCGVPKWLKFLMVGGVIGAILASYLVHKRDTMFAEGLYDWEEGKFANWDEEKSAAFIGNSYLFVNDVPRLVSKISGGKVHQDSCLRSSSSLGKLLRAGNGMYEYWQTSNALTYKFDTEWTVTDDDEQYREQQQEGEDGEYDENYNGQSRVYDFGSCSVFQMLEGYDNDLTYQNYNGAYYDEDGTNPCFEDENYIIFLNDKNLKDPPRFDYVVLNDQTLRMADPSASLDSVSALKYAYAPMIKDSRAVPLIVDTHAYPYEYGSNKTIVGYGESIPYFQALIYYYGVQHYMNALKSNLPKSQAPEVVPVGMAYLTVWEEDYSLWQKLFLDSQYPVHASPHGSYLFANVLYAKMYGHLPKRPDSDRRIMMFFSTARYMPALPDDYSGIFPTVAESDYLRLVARRVALQGYVPNSFTDAKNQIEYEMKNGKCVCNTEYWYKTSNYMWQNGDYQDYGYGYDVEEAEYGDVDNGQDEYGYGNEQAYDNNGGGERYYYDLQESGAYPDYECKCRDGRNGFYAIKEENDEAEDNGGR